MEKRCFLAVFLFFLVALPAYAVEDDETQTYSGSAATGETITVNGENFVVSFGGDPAKISVKLPSGYGVVVDKGVCEVEGYYDICFDSSSFWYHNYTTDRDFYKAAIKIYEVLALTTLTRIIEKSNFLILEETKINVVMENTGRRAATDVVFRDEFPASFAITSVEGCELEGNVISWKGSINMNGKKECSYVIKALEAITYISKASLNYNDGSTLRDITDSKTITVPTYRLSLATSLEDAIEVGGDIEMAIELANLHDSYEIKVVNFYVDVPTELDAVEKSNLFTQEYNQYKWSGTLAPLEKNNFYLKLKGTSVGEYKIKEYAEYIINNIRKKIQNELVVKVTGPVLSVGYDISKKSLKAGEESRILIEATNPSSKYPIKSIELAVESDIPGFKEIRKAIGDLEAGKTITILNTQFTAPNLDMPGTYSVDITTSYESDFGKGKTKNNEEIKISSLAEDSAEEAAEGTTTEETNNASEELTTDADAKTGIWDEEAKNATSMGELISGSPKSTGFLGSMMGVALLAIIVVVSLVVFVAERKHRHVDFFKKKLEKIKSVKKPEASKKDKKVAQKEGAAKKQEIPGWKKRILAIKEKIKKKEAPIQEMLMKKFKELEKKEAPIKEEIEKRIEDIKEKARMPGIRVIINKEEKKSGIKEKEVEEELKELEKTGKDIKEHEKTKFRF